MAVDLGTSATVTFANSAFAGAIRNIKHSGVTRPSIKTSHLGTTTADSFIVGDLYDPGQMTLEVLFDPGIARPPYNGAAENITITFPDANTFAASGFVIDFGYEIPHEDLITAEVTVKFSGAITVTT